MHPPGVRIPTIVLKPQARFRLVGRLPPVLLSVGGFCESTFEIA
jgi:hypothetical protein